MKLGTILITEEFFLVKNCCVKTISSNVDKVGKLDLQVLQKHPIVDHTGSNKYSCNYAKIHFVQNFILIGRT